MRQLPCAPLDLSNMRGAPSKTHRISRRSALKYFGGLGVSVAAAYLTGCVPGEASPTASPPPPSKTTPYISVYSALNESTNNAFIAAFRAATPGLDVSVLPLAATGELQTRIQAQKYSPKADIFVGGSSEFHEPLAKEGLLESYKSPNAGALDPKYQDPSGFWTGWYLGIFGLVLNTERFAKEMPGVKKPTGWDDLLDPTWRGKLILPDPAKTGGGYIFLATQVFRFNRDEDKAIDFMKRLHGNVAQYVGIATQGIQLVGAGQFIGCPNWAHDILLAKNQGQPVDLIVPEKTGFEVGAVSIVKGGPNTEGARKFVDWVLTKEAGELNVHLSNRLSLRGDVAPAPGAPTLDRVNMVEYDRAWASSQKDRLVQKWQGAIGYRGQWNANLARLG